MKRSLMGPEIELPETQRAGHARRIGARAVEEQAASNAANALGFDERLTLLVHREIAWRDDRRVQRLLKAAKLKVGAACVEDINWRASRALDRSLVAALAEGDWLRRGQNLLITGMTEYAT